MTLCPGAGLEDDDAAVHPADGFVLLHDGSRNGRLPKDPQNRRLRKSKRFGRIQKIFKDF
jgi:hypothetical protein